MIHPSHSAEYSSSAYLVELAQDGDEDADAIVRCLKLTHGSDTLALIRSHLLSLLSSPSPSPSTNSDQEPNIIPGVSSNDDNNNDISLTRHVTHIHQRLPPPSSSQDDPILSFFKKYHYQSVRLCLPLPSNPNMYTLSRKFFTRNMGPILIALGHFSLAGGFSSKKIMPVLKATGYLTTSNSRTVTRRLFETCQFIMDVMTKSPELAWESTTRVRFLHAQVRVRLRKNEKAKDGEGVPINQQHLLTALASFSVLPVWSLHTLGIPLDMVEVEAYIAHWKEIGFYLGIRATLLNHHFATYITADQFARSTILHHFMDADILQPTILLRALAFQPPLHKPAGAHFELSRLLMGSDHAQSMHIPHDTWLEKLYVITWKWLSRLFDSTARFYDNYLPFLRWTDRVTAIQIELIDILVGWNVGGQQDGNIARTAFDLKENNVDSLHQDAMGLHELEKWASAEIHHHHQKRQSPKLNDDVLLMMQRKLQVAEYVKKLRWRYLAVILEPVLLIATVLGILILTNYSSSSTPPSSNLNADISDIQVKAHLCL